MKAKKSLGQNFLKNDSVLEDIAELADISEETTVLEIGPGHGELTGFLVKKNPKRIIVIEKDEVLAIKMRSSFPEITVITGDALEILPDLDLPAEWTLIGNIPYYITGHLLRILPDLPSPPAKSILLVQKEVAERVCATPPEANLLSSMIRGWAEPEYLFEVDRNEFDPVPEVDSALFSLIKKDSVAPSGYFETVRSLFKQPRKKAINNLSDSLNIKKDEAIRIFSECDISPAVRPQDLDTDNILCISRKIKI